jgi:phosphoribosylaminoimidazole (AIR) synthetase
MHLPYSKRFPVDTRSLFGFNIEGVAPKFSLLTAGNTTPSRDAVAMAVNDVIRSGATPLAISDNIHAQASNPNW